MIDYRHYWNGNGYTCPLSNETVKETYTDPKREGSFNACKLCGDRNFTVARDLRLLAEKRKKEAELA